MSNEEFEKKAEFIVEQQAQFASKIGQLEDIVARLAKPTLDRFEVSDKRIDEIDERMAALINSQIQTEENVKKTDEHLRNLIAVVDRYFSGRSKRRGKDLSRSVVINDAIQRSAARRVRVSRPFAYANVALFPMPVSLTLEHSRPLGDEHTGRIEDAHLLWRNGGSEGVFVTTLWSSQRFSNCKP
jgi:hypothetical protein